eukprot:TRINITY_DN14647_c0_g1_i1.p1 TRINITY_DN14647_c0_g1~~TRINITY_DN14647_c0_g1_i1.p1  ORF type:complete len:346 (+),score=36.34 TRINITY_DN14647_c0_g1_i1:86-1123(+)
MGLAGLLAGLLQPSALGDLDSDVIFRREVKGYLEGIREEMKGFSTLAIPREMIDKRRERVQDAEKKLLRFFDAFSARRRRRNVLTINRASLAYDASMGYCNIHDLLIQLVRDWGSDNDNIRRSHHEIVLSEVKAHMREGTSVLVPGDALCRTSWQLASLGVFKEVIANEASPLFTEMAHFILNCIEEPLDVCPHAGIFNNQDSIDGHLRTVTVPSPLPTETETHLQMNIGPFESLYSKTGSEYKQFEMVVTCFFLDTIPGSVTAALQIIVDLLPPGGIWINHGPLLYRGDAHPKLSWEEIIALLPGMGMEILKTEMITNAEYCEKAETSLHPTIYNPRLLVAKKL